MAYQVKYAVALVLLIAVTSTNSAVLQGNQPNKNKGSSERFVNLETDVSPCGGQGTITDIRIPHCTTFPCLLVPGVGDHLVQVDFVAAQSHHEDLQVHAVLTTFDQSQVSVFSEGPFDMKITKDRSYTLTYKIALPSTLTPGLASLKLSFVGSSGVHEVCVDLLDKFEI